MTFLSRQNLNQSLGTWILFFCCTVAIGALQLPESSKFKNNLDPTSVTVINRELEAEKLRLDLLHKLPSFGFHNLIADWTFLNFLQYFGDDSSRAKTGYSLSPEYFEVIIGRDPYFLDAYVFLSGSTTLYAGMPERTIALMNEGLKHLSPGIPPKSYYVWRYKGSDELLFMGNAQAAKQSFETAAQWASHYSDPESQYVAQFSRQTAQLLADNPRSKSAQISAWTIVLNNAFDDRTRQLAVSRIQALGGKVLITPEGEVQIQLPKND